MSSLPHSPPGTAFGEGMSIPNVVEDIRSDAEVAREAKVPAQLDKQMETLAVKASEESLPRTPSTPPPVANLAAVIIPQDSDERIDGNEAGPEIRTSQGTEQLEPFDWADFESRYISTMEEANEKDRLVLAEFHDIVKYFNVWATASANHDSDRAVKRLKTREAYVQHADSALESKLKHYTDVVDAFKSALAMLGGF